MRKNITLNAEAEIIRKAREKAKYDRTTLNSMFRLWLEQYVAADKRITDFNAYMERFSYVQPGKKFSREELNER